jgi:hypothetical protein
MRDGKWDDSLKVLFDGFSLDKVILHFIKGPKENENTQEWAVYNNIEQLEKDYDLNKDWVERKKKNPNMSIPEPKWHYQSKIPMVREKFLAKLVELRNKSPWILELFKEALEKSKEARKDTKEMNERKAVYQENFSVDSSQGKSMKWVYDELWDLLQIHFKRKESEFKDKNRKKLNTETLTMV